MDGVGAWARLHPNYSRRNVGANVQGTTRVHVPEAREKRWPSAAGDHAVGLKRKAMMSGLGGNAKILELWRMSALLVICPKYVKEQMLVRLDRRELREPQGEGDIPHEQG